LGRGRGRVVLCFGGEGGDGGVLGEFEVGIFGVCVGGSVCGAVVAQVGDGEAFAKAPFGGVGFDAVLEPGVEPGVLFDEGTPYSYAWCQLVQDDV